MRQKWSNKQNEHTFKFQYIFLHPKEPREKSVKMGKKDKGKKKGKGAEKTAMKTDKKLVAKQKKLLEKIGEVRFINRTHVCRFVYILFFLPG